MPKRGRADALVSLSPPPRAIPAGRQPMSTNNPESKSRRKAVAKSPRRQGEKPVKVGIYLSVECFRRLGIKSLMDGQDKSQIVEELIRNHLPRYVVQVRSDRGSEGEMGGEV